MKNALIPLYLLLLSGTALADSDCRGRAATAAEEAAHKTIMTAFQKASAPAPKGWGVAQESPIEPLVTACKDAERYPTKYDFGRAYSNTAAIEGRQEGVNEKMAAVIKGQEKLAAGNAGAIAALDKKSEALQKRMEKAAAASDVKELEAIGKEMAALYEKRAKLESGDTGAQSDQIAQAAEFDTKADLSITANSESLILSEFKPMKLAGYPLAYRQTLAEGANPEDALVVLLGDWKLSDGTAEPASPLEGKPHTKVHTIVVRVRAAPATAKALLQATKLEALKALIAR